MHRLFLILFIIPSSLSAQQPFDVRTESAFFILRHDRNIGRQYINRLLEQFDTDYRYFRDYFETRVDGKTLIILHNSEFTFQQASGAARGAYGSVRDGVIHLVPIEKLREDGWLSAAVTQQVIRLLLYSRLINGCPRWLYEGAAAHHAGISGLYVPPPVLTVRTFSDLNELYSTARSPRDYAEVLTLSALSFESLLKRYGEIHVLTLLRLFNGSYEVREAVAHSLGATYDRVEQLWLRDIQQFLDELGRRRGR